MRRYSFAGHFLLLLLLFPFQVHAEREGFCVTAEVTDISPTSIKIGDEFTVGILIDNCGGEPPENVTFELRDVSPYIGVKESLYKEIGQMGYANSERFILYHMKVSDDAVPGEYEFDYRLLYTAENIQYKREGNFSIQVIGDEAELAVASVKVDPVLPLEGDTVELTLRIENTGSGSAKSVRVDAYHPYEGTKQSFIGTLEPNEDGPAIFTFIVTNAGEAKFPVVIRYADDFGEHELTTEVSVNVLQNDSDRGKTLVVVAVLAVAGLLAYSIARTIRAKNRIIQQLLKGNRVAERKK